MPTVRFVAYAVCLFCFLGFFGEASPQTQIDASQLRTTVVNVSVNGRRSSHAIFCFTAIAGVVVQRSGVFIFTPYQIMIRNQQKRNPSSRKLPLLKAISSSGKRACRVYGSPPASSTPVSGVGAPPSSPSATPLPTNSSTSKNFDLSGNVTPQGKTAFGIPTHLDGNVTSGLQVFKAFCVGCHVERVGYSYPLLDTNIRKSPMLYDDSAITRQQLADLTAYLNRFRF